jgi:Pyridoxamine 5'-phosphate oxidase
MSLLVLTQEIKDLVNGSLESGNPILLAAVDAAGRPLLSFRGSTTVHSDDQLGLWARNAAGGTIEAIQQNPNVALMYRSATIPLLRFEGRARIATAAERDAIYEAAPQQERDGDAERKGTAIVVDLDTVFGVLGFGKEGPIIAQLKR